MNAILQSCIDNLRRARDAAARHGYQVDRVSIGVSPNHDCVRACDDTGAYDYVVGDSTGRLLRFGLGCPSRALSDVAQRVERGDYD